MAAPTREDLEREQYIGDAVYARFDGFSIWLRTGDGQAMQIAMEPAVLFAFDKYRAHLATAIDEFTGTPERGKAYKPNGGA